MPQYLLFRRFVPAFATIALAACAPGGCTSLEPLPAPIPTSQTVEGGIQIRMTESGFGKVKELAGGLITDALAGGFCVPPTSLVNIGLTEPWLCTTVLPNDGDGCDLNAGKGCQIEPTITRMDIDVIDADTVRVDLDIEVHEDIPIYWDNWIVSDGLCWGRIELGPYPDDPEAVPGRVVADIDFGIDSTTGELTVNVAGIHELDISGIEIDACGLGEIVELFSGFLSDYLVDMIEPVLQDYVNGFLPSPLGIEGRLDVGSLLGGIFPGVQARIETRAVAGGYVQLDDGMSLGVIFGLNADADTSTRAGALASESARCVPSRLPPDLAPLTTTSRGNFRLPASGVFVGSPDPDTDLVLGLSETALDLAGHHAISAGALCIEAGYDLVPQLTLGTFALLVPSLSALGEGTGEEPMLVALRPQQPLDFSIGDGTTASPALTAHIRELELDMYAYVHGRYTRAFTIVLTADLGLNLEFTTDAMGNAAVRPVLTGLDSGSVNVQVYNNELVAESAAELEDLVPGVLDLVVPLLGGALGPIALPELGGFELSEMSVAKVVTADDDFLAINARLAAVAGKRSAPAETRARLGRVDVPSAVAIANHVHGRPDGAFPRVEIELGDEPGLEHQWRYAGGIWHPYQPGARLVLSEPAFMFRGRYAIELRARRVGDFRSEDPTPEVIQVVIDPATPPGVAPLAEPSGCSAVPGGGGGIVGALLILVAILALRGRHGCAAVVTVGLAACGSDESGVPPAQPCELDEECGPCEEANTIPMCVDQICSCAKDLPRGDVGGHADIGVSPAGEVWVAAYNDTYGDLIVGRVPDTGRVPAERFEFVDGIPDGPVVLEGAKVRGGIRADGPNVGTHTSLAVGAAGPMVAYYDVTGRSLKLARREGDAWVTLVIDTGDAGDPDAMGTDVGRYASLSIGADGHAGIAYHAIVRTAEETRTELRYALATTPTPTSISDFRVLVIDSAVLPVYDEANPAPLDVPLGTGLFPATARLADGAPAVAYYDQLDASLYYVRYDLGTQAFGAPELVDGGASVDVGRHPSIAVTEDDVVHLTYFDALQDALYYVNLTDRVVEVADDGYRIDGTTSDGIPRPVFHKVGYDSSLIALGDVVAAVYHDSTAHAVSWAIRNDSGSWGVTPIIGGQEPWRGAYGFYTSAERAGGNAYIATWAVDLANEDSWIEVLAWPFAIE